MTQLSPCHLAFPVHDLEVAREFYGTVLELSEGRSDATWIDFDLYGHQIVVHERPEMAPPEERNHHNQVDGHAVPVPHFGVVLSMKEWQELAERLQLKELQFVIEPYIRFEGEVGEQAR